MPLTRAIDPAELEVLHGLLPASLVPHIDETFIRSCFLYDEYVFRLSLEVVRRSGIEGAALLPGTVEEICARAGLASAVTVGWFLRELVEYGAAVRGPATAAGPASPLGEASLAIGANHYRIVTPLPLLDPREALELQRQLDPSWLPAYEVAEVAAAAYPAFLRGELSGEEILFSPGRLELWSAYFSNANGLYAINNRVAALAADTWLADAGAAPLVDGRAAILELGGGLGSAAIALLDRFTATGRLGFIARYRFSDSVPAFLRRGQRAIRASVGDDPRFSFERIDLDRPLAPQGVEPHSVSLLFAVNTVHVARDLAATLAELRTALRPGGLLVLGEGVRHHPEQPTYIDFVFNLTDAFLAARLDPALRPSGGFLTREHWQASLESAGFRDVRFMPDLAGHRDRFPRFYVAAIGATAY